MSEVSKELSLLQKTGEIKYYYKFLESKTGAKALGDHLILTNDLRFIILEEKMTRATKKQDGTRMGSKEIFSDNKAHQRAFNRLLKLPSASHYYILGFYPKRQKYYVFIDDIYEVKRVHKSYISMEDFVRTDSLSSLLRRIIDYRPINTLPTDKSLAQYQVKEELSINKKVK